MQDFVFSQGQRSRQKTTRLITRFLVLMLIGGGVGYGIYSYNNKKTTNASPTTPSLLDDQLAIPAAKYPNASLQQLPVESTPQIADKAATVESLPEDAQPVVVQQEQPAVELIQSEPATSTAITETKAEPAETTWREHVIQPGDSLASVFKKHGLAPSLLDKIIKCSKSAAELARVRPGEKLKFGLDAENKLTELIWEKDRISSLHVQAEENGFVSSDNNQPVDVRETMASGIIESSLFVDGQKAGLSDPQIMDLAEIFAWDIDFALDLRRGDSFSLLYEEHLVNGEKVRNGPILAAEFINDGKIYRALRYSPETNLTDYYDPEGRSKRNQFIRTPVKFSRISSLFTPKRWHPVLQTWRSHKGVDYAAPTGTPVKTTGHGKVAFVGLKDGYGKVIFVQHGSQYMTVYGHLSKFARNLKVGSSVQQGDTIGYVGATGLATGPHLHYEFRVNGEHRNPLTVKLPKSEPLPKEKFADFKKHASDLLEKLDQASAQKVVAKSSATVDSL